MSITTGERAGGGRTSITVSSSRRASPRWARHEPSQTNTRLDIRFDEKGKPYRFYNDFCPGWAASNNGGGTYERELAEDFFVGETLESMASWLERFRTSILKNEDLDYYLRTANKRYRK